MCTKKNIKNILCVLTTAAAALLLVFGCNDKIDVQQQYDYTVRVLPYYSEVELDEPVELRFQIMAIDGTWSNNIYKIRYFPKKGKGTFAHENGTHYMPNDLYPVNESHFRLYYTPATGTSHEIEVVIVDSFNNEKTLNFTFTISENNKQ